MLLTTNRIILNFNTLYQIISLITVLSITSLWCGHDDPPYSSPLDPYNYELNSIIFSGNETFDNLTLLGAIRLRESDRSISHQVFQYMFDNIIQFGFVPNVYKAAFYQRLDERTMEIRYFSRNHVEKDVESLADYYNRKGFHEAEVSFAFYGNPETKKNVLEFVIDEGERSFTGPVNYIGLDSLPYDVKLRVDKQILINDTVPFDEDLIMAEVEGINLLLKNWGYYYDSLNAPPKVVKSSNNTDSVVVFFDTGKRVKVLGYEFVDSLRNQPKVVDGLKEKLIDLSNDGWYRMEDRQESISRMISLGTFDRVLIDTSSQHGHVTDSTLTFVVLTQYRKSREWGTGIFLNESYDNATNLGFEIEFQHRNLLNAAQNFRLFGNIGIRDVGSLLSNPEDLARISRWEYETQLGFNFTQPYLFMFDKTVVNLSTLPLYSFRRINEIRISTIVAPIKFPIILPGNTFFSNIIVDFTFERQEPDNFAQTISDLKNNAQSLQDSLRVEQAIRIYGDLDDYFRSPESGLFSSNLLGVSLISDKRNNLFEPTSGHFFNMTLDGSNVFLSYSILSALANYLRAQISHYQYISLGRQAVLALKGHAGAIWLFESGNSYVPLDRQFFAGGANSVRGWPTRKLRYTKLPVDSLGGERTYDLVEDIIGNKQIIEGSIELRYRFTRPENIGGVIATQIANIGVTTFVDFGNAYNWLIGDETGKLKLLDVFSNLAVSWGVGIRYATPIGPFRLDFAWPLHDPLGKRDPFTNTQFHIGLGHAF